MRVHAPDILIESGVLLLERIFRNLLSNALGFPVMYKPIQPGRLRSVLGAILAKNPLRQEMPGPR